MPDVEIDISQSDIKRFLNLYVAKSLSKESREIHEQYMPNVKEALYRAVLNESFIMCINDAISAHEVKND